MTIPTSFLDELRTRTTLSTVIGATYPIKRAGREFRACCPFHQEKTPSFYVNDAKGFYHCFGCQAHGDVISWMVDHEGMPFIDAVKELAAKAGLEIPASDPAAARKEKQRQDSVDIMARAQRFYASTLDAGEGDMEASAAVLYLTDRGVSGKIISEFGIGYAPGSRRGSPPPLISALRGNVDDMVRLGLAKIHPEEKRPYDFFRRRIMIPIHDARGAVIAFGGRIVGQGEPKYLNSPDTPIFDKGRTLFNIHRVAPAARATGRLMIVEGYMDVIGLHAVGFESAVAPNGTALTEHQMFLAWKLVDAPVVCFDGDKAGQKAAARAATRALTVMEPGKTLRFAVLPDGKDPDDIAREQGLEAINALYDGAITLVDVLWRHLTDTHNIADPDGRAALGAAISDMLGTIKDANVRESYRTALRERFGRGNSRSRNTRAAPRAKAGSVAEAMEAALITGLVARPPVIEGHGEDLLKLPWRNVDNARLVDVLCQTTWDAQESSTDTFLAAIERAGLSSHVAAQRQMALNLNLKTDQALLTAIRANFR